MSSRFILSVAFPVVTALIASGCIGGYEVVQGPPVVQFVGRLTATASCDWLEDENGAVRVVIYPLGWEVAPDPTRLLDAKGHVVAREGDVLRVSGTLDPTGQSLCFPGGTKVGPVMGVDSVEVLATTAPS